MNWHAPNGSYETETRDAQVGGSLGKIVDSTIIIIIIIMINNNYIF